MIALLESNEFVLDEEPFDIAQHKTKSTLQKELIEDFKWLLEHCETHASIDTFAKKLWIKSHSNPEYERLKLVLSIFLIVEQMKNPPDKRYDLFYASICTSSKKVDWSWV